MNGYTNIGYVKCELTDSDASVGSKSYVAVKKCRMMRSGIQLYARDEVPEDLLKLLPEEKRNQPYFKVYRKPEAIVKHINDFNYIAFVNTHPNEDVTPDNYTRLSIGTVGGTAHLVTLDDGNVYVENDVVFTDKEAYKDYEHGKKEVSIGMECLWRLSDEGSESDFEVFDFANVNHLALVDRARAGRAAKILDSDTVLCRLSGGNQMNFLRLLGFKKPVDDAEKLLSEKLFAGVNQLKEGMKEDEINSVVSSVMDGVDALRDTEQKKVLTGIIKDALSNPAVVLEADEETRKTLADSIDKLYEKCKALDSDEAQKVINDACSDTQEVNDEKAEKSCEDEKADEKEAEKSCEDEKEEDKKDEKEDDKSDKKSVSDTDVIAKAVEEAVAKALDAAKIDAKVDAAVKKALNLDNNDKLSAEGAVADADVNFDDNDLLPNGWGR